MPSSDSAPIWDSLAASASRLASTDSQELLQDAARNEALRHTLAGCHFDFSRQRVDQHALTQLLHLADSVGLPAKRDAMFAGEKINRSEN